MGAIAALVVMCTFETEIVKMAEMNCLWVAWAPGVTYFCRLQTKADTVEIFWEHKWLFISKIGHKFKHAVINYQHNINIPQQNIICLWVTAEVWAKMLNCCLLQLHRLSVVHCIQQNVRRQYLPDFKSDMQMCSKWLTTVDLNRSFTNHVFPYCMCVVVPTI